MIRIDNELMTLHFDGNEVNQMSFNKSSGKIIITFKNKDQTTIDKGSKDLYEKIITLVQKEKMK